ncbi:MAG: putative lipid II flippase FtsW [bacterium]|nr:putative lipid II flippase FtsW [bacterium]
MRLSKLDWPLLVIVLLLALLGVIMVFSTTAVTGLNDYGDPHYFVKKQLIFLVLGLFALFIGYQIDYRLYKKYALYGIAFSVILLAITLVPGVGIKSGGARRWLNLGIFQLQSVELVKFAIAAFLSAALARKQHAIHDFRKGLLPILLVIGLPIILISQQPDLGNIILIMIVMGLLFWVGRVPFKQLASLGVGAVSLIFLSLLINPYQLRRISAFFNPWADPLGQNYHVIQSFIAIGSGGIFGHGFGNSKLKFFYLPLHYSDFIFSVICEEGGLLLAIIVVLLFVALLVRSCTLAKELDDPFGYFLAIALTLFIVVQAILNISVVIGLMPVTGIPLTFISYGGSSYVISLFIVGVLLNVFAVGQQESGDS